MSEHVFIAGGSSGIGLAAASHLLGLGFKVTIAGRDPAKLEAARASLTGDLAVVVMDATDPTRVRAVLAETGPIDHLVLAVGSGKGGGPFATLDLASLRAGFEEKVFAHCLCAQAALPSLRRDGGIIFLSAVSAQAAFPGTAGLGAANAAVAALVPILAAELRPLRVNGVSPGVIDTPWWDFLPAEKRAEAFADYAARTPVGRVGTAVDVAQAIAFLVSNTFMTGHMIVCDGGVRLGA